ncbi:MAG: sodium:solute symporter family protein [Rickettsiales bacterium]|nr:sodium:solute symporter family protein [Rickettsiales bacterium]
MNLIDISIVIGYMLFCLIIGLLRYGKIKNIRDYTLGTKPFPTVVLMVTTLATVFGTGNMVGRIEKIYKLGLIYIIPLAFIPLSWIILAKILTPNLQVFHNHKFISLSDIMEYWYGKTGRWSTNITSILLSMAITAISTIAIGYLLHYFINIPEKTGMIIGLVIVTIYSVFGGVTSVAFTDVFQALIFFIALPLACFISYQHTEGVEKIWLSLPKSHTQINIESLPLFFSFIFFALIPNAEIPFIQRALIAKDKKQFLRSFIGVAILIIPLLAIVTALGLITYYNNPNVKSGIILYYFIDQYLPIGIKGLIIAGVLAAIMSTQDSFLNTTSALISHDICKQIWPSLTDKQELLIARTA